MKKKSINKLRNILLIIAIISVIADILITTPIALNKKGIVEKNQNIDEGIKNYGKVYLLGYAFVIIGVIYIMGNGLDYTLKPIGKFYQLPSMMLFITSSYPFLSSAISNLNFII